jgi:hypothetical protein
MSEKNIGGLRLNLKATGIDELLEKLDRLNKLLQEANSLKQELANSEITVKLSSQADELEQVD